MSDLSVESPTRDSPEPSRRVDVFAPRTPTGTTVRFALLVALVLGTSLFIHAAVLPPGFVHWSEVGRQCETTANLAPLPEPGLTPMEQRAIHQQRMESCLGEYVPERLGWMIGGLAGLLLLAGVLYRVQPRWRIRRSRLVPLDEAAAPDLAAELDGLVARAGLRTKPRFLVDPVSPRTSGLAFGSGRRGYLALDAGLLTLHHTDVRSFRVVVLHELAHLRNGDVRITYLTVAVWRAFLLVALLPWVVALFDPWLFSSTPLRSPFDMWDGDYLLLVGGAGVRILVLVALVYLSRNAVLRARERYADARVSAWVGSVEPRECLPSGQARRGGWWRTHPSIRARMAALATPSMLLRPGFWESVLAGIALQLAASQVGSVLEDITSESAVAVDLGEGFWGLGLAVFILVAGLRMAAFRRLTDTSRWWAALWPAVGVVAGSLLARNQAAVGYLPSLVPSTATLVGALFLVPMVLAACCWVSWCAELVRNGSTARRVAAPVLAAVTVGLIGVSVLSNWSGATSMANYAHVIGSVMRAVEGYVREGAWTGADLLVLAVVDHPALLLVDGGVAMTVGLTLVWLVPLWLQGLGAGRRMRWAILAALLGTGGWLAADLVLRGIARATTGPERRITDVFEIVFLRWEILLQLAAQLAVTLVLVVRGRGLAVSLFAGATTGTLAVLLQWALWNVEACVPFLRTAFTSCPSPHGTTFGGALLEDGAVRGMIVMLLAAVLGVAIRALRPPRRLVAAAVAESLAPTRPGAVRFAAVVVAAVAVVSVGVPVLPARQTGLSGIGAAILAERNSQRPLSTAEAHRQWLRSGGADHLVEIFKAFDAFRVKLKELHDAGATGDLSPLIPTLRTFADAASRAAVFPGPPGAEAGQAWRTELAKLERAATSMIEAIPGDPRTLTVVLVQALDDLTTGMDGLHKLVVPA